MVETKTTDLADLAQLLETNGGKAVFDGEELTVEKLRQIRDRSKNTEADYTKKTQALAEERRKLQERASELEPWVKTAEYFNQNPDKAEMLEKLMKGEKIEQSKNEVKSDPRLLEKLTALEKRLQQKEQQEQFNAEVQNTQRYIASKLQELKKEFPEFKDKEVLVELSTKDLSNVGNEDFENIIKDVVKSNHDSRVQERETLLKEYIDKKKGLNTRSEGGSSSPSTLKDKPMSGKSLLNGDVRRKATEYMQSLDNEE